MVMKGENRLRNCPKWETKSHNLMVQRIWDLVWPEKKDISGKAGETQVREMFS